MNGFDECLEICETKIRWCFNQHLICEPSRLGGGNSTIFDSHPETWGRFPFSDGLVQPPTRRVIYFSLKHRLRLKLDVFQRLKSDRVGLRWISFSKTTGLNQHRTFFCQQLLFSCFLFIPIGSMYGIFAYIWLIFMVNVGKYTIHGSYGIYQAFLNLWIVVLRHVRQVPGFSNYVWKTTWEKRDLVVCLGKKENIQKSWKR